MANTVLKQKKPRKHESRNHSTEISIGNTERRTATREESFAYLEFRLDFLFGFVRKPFCSHRSASPPEITKTFFYSTQPEIISKWKEEKLIHVLRLGFIDFKLTPICVPTQKHYLVLFAIFISLRQTFKSFLLQSEIILLHALCSQSSSQTSIKASFFYLNDFIKRVSERIVIGWKRTVKADAIVKIVKLRAIKCIKSKRNGDNFSPRSSFHLVDDLRLTLIAFFRQRPRFIIYDPTRDQRPEARVIGAVGNFRSYQSA